MNFVVRQFERPHGTLGALAGWIMANRPSNRQRNAWTAELIAPGADDIVLEIGCGPGLALTKVCRRAGKVVAIDHSELMLRKASARNADAVRNGRLELRHGGLEILPQLNTAFDRVYSVNVAMFWKDKRAAFAAIKAAMRRGGTVATTHQPRRPGATEADALSFAETIIGAMQTAGFKAIRRELLPLNPAPAVCVLGESG